MAEIGLAASAIQVAATGLKCAETLYQYADSVASSKRRITAIALQVKLTSTIVDELQHVFKDAASEKLVSQDAVDTANQTMSECHRVFKDIEAAVGKSKSTLGKFTFPFKEPKLALYRADLERLKSSLQLLISILIHAGTLTQAQDRSTIESQRIRISELIASRDVAIQQYEASRKQYEEAQKRGLPGLPEGRLPLTSEAVMSSNFVANPVVSPGISSTPLLSSVTRPCSAEHEHLQRLAHGEARTSQGLISQLSMHIDQLKEHINRIENLQKDLIWLERKSGLDSVYNQVITQPAACWRDLRDKGDRLFGTHRQSIHSGSAWRSATRSGHPTIQSRPRGSFSEPATLEGRVRHDDLELENSSLSHDESVATQGHECDFMEGHDRVLQRIAAVAEEHDRLRSKGGPDHARDITEGDEPRHAAYTRPLEINVILRGTKPFDLDAKMQTDHVPAPDMNFLRRNSEVKPEFVGMGKPTYSIEDLLAKWTTIYSP